MKPTGSAGLGNHLHLARARRLIAGSVDGSRDLARIIGFIRRRRIEWRLGCSFVPETRTRNLPLLIG
jgi:hypothetical protein